VRTVTVFGVVAAPVAATVVAVAAVSLGGRRGHDPDVPPPEASAATRTGTASTVGVVAARSWSPS